MATGVFTAGRSGAAIRGTKEDLAPSATALVSSMSTWRTRSMTRNEAAAMVDRLMDAIVEKENAASRDKRTAATL